MAIGSGSATAARVTAADIKLSDRLTLASGDWAGNTGTQVFSVGGGTKRQIQNVGAGQIAAASTDAINGSQLFAVATQLDGQNGKLAGKVSTILGAGTVGSDFTITPPSGGFGGTGKNTVNDALAAINKQAEGTFFVQKDGGALASIGLTASGETPTQGIKFTDGTYTTATVGSANGLATVSYDVNTTTLAAALAGDGVTATNGKLTVTAKGGETYSSGTGITVESDNTINLDKSIAVDQIVAGSVTADNTGLNVGGKKSPLLPRVLRIQMLSMLVS